MSRMQVSNGLGAVAGLPGRTTQHTQSANGPGAGFGNRTPR
jgi:hypothetical protein